MSPNYSYHHYYHSIVSPHSNCYGKQVEPSPKKSLAEVEVMQLKQRQSSLQSSQSSSPTRVLEVTECAEVEAIPDSASVTMDIISCKEAFSEALASVQRRTKYILHVLHNVFLINTKRHVVVQSNMNRITMEETSMISKVSQQQRVKKSQNGDRDIAIHDRISVSLKDEHAKNLQPILSYLRNKLGSDPCVTIHPPVFSARNETWLSLRSEASTKAVEGAMRKATLMAEKMNEKLGPVLSLRESMSKDDIKTVSSMSDGYRVLHVTSTIEIAVSLQDKILQKQHIPKSPILITRPAQTDVPQVCKKQSQVTLHPINTGLYSEGMRYIEAISKGDILGDDTCQWRNRVWIA